MKAKRKEKERASEENFRKRTRNVFTKQDLAELVSFLASNGGSKNGKEIYKKLAENNNAHTAQSWRSHYLANREVLDYFIRKKQNSMKIKDSISSSNKNDKENGDKNVERRNHSPEHYRKRSKGDDNDRNLDNHKPSKEQSHPVFSPAIKSTINITSDEENEFVNFLSKYSNPDSRLSSEIYEDYSKLAPSYSALQYFNYYKAHQDRLTSKLTPKPPRKERSKNIELPISQSNIEVEDERDQDYDLLGSLSVSTGSSDEDSIFEQNFCAKKERSHQLSLTRNENSTISALTKFFQAQEDDDYSVLGPKKKKTNKSYHEKLSRELLSEKGGCEHSTEYKDNRSNNDLPVSPAYSSTNLIVIHDQLPVVAGTNIQTLGSKSTYRSVEKDHGGPESDRRVSSPDVEIFGNSNHNRLSVTSHQTNTAASLASFILEPNNVQIQNDKDNMTIVTKMNQVDRGKKQTNPLPVKRFSLGSNKPTSGNFPTRKSNSNLTKASSSRKTTTTTARTISSFKPEKDPTTIEGSVAMIKIFLNAFQDQYSPKEALKLLKQCGGWTLMFEVATLRTLNNESEEGDERYSERVQSMIWTEEEDQLIIKLIALNSNGHFWRKKAKIGCTAKGKSAATSNAHESHSGSNFNDLSHGDLERLKSISKDKGGVQAILNRIRFLNGYLNKYQKNSTT